MGSGKSGRDFITNYPEIEQTESGMNLILIVVNLL